MWVLVQQSSCGSQEGLMVYLLRGNENRSLSVTSQRLDIEPVHGIVWGNHQTSTYSSLWWPCESDATPHKTLLAWGLHWTATTILSWILRWERNKCIKKNALCSKETLLDECLYITDVGFKGSSFKKTHWRRGEVRCLEIWDATTLNIHDREGNSER